MDERLIIGVLVAAASSYLFIVIIRKFLDAIDNVTKGKFYSSGWVKPISTFLDTLLPVLPCVPSGLTTMLIMYYWPPDALWDSSLLHFLIGCLAGVVASSIYYTITRAFEKKVASLIPPTSPDPPATPEPPKS